jgi:hypothetical protein
MAQPNSHWTDVFLLKKKSNDHFRISVLSFVCVGVENVKELTGDIQRQIKENYELFWPIQLQLRRAQVC